MLSAGLPNSEHSPCATSLHRAICCDILGYWKPYGELRLPQLMVLLGAYRVVKNHNQDWSLTKPWLPLRTQSSERTSAKSLKRPFSAFAETPATACRSREASSPTP